MAYLNPQDAFDHFRDRILEGIQRQFPIKGRGQSVQLKELSVKDNLYPFDIRGQYKARTTGDTWAVPVYANLELRDDATGNVLSNRTIRIAEIPKVTNRHSFIVKGKEYQIDNQWQLKPGVYTRRRQNGELESRFNVVGRPAFDLMFDPASKQFFMEYGKSKLPLYPMMKAIGVEDGELEKVWGKEIFTANKTARGVAGAVERFFKTDTKRQAPSREDAEDHLRQVMATAELRPEAVELTLGKPFSHVTGEALRLATQKMLKVQAGHPEDDRDSLLFKDLRSAGDFAYDKLRAAAKVIQVKAQRQLNRGKTDVREVVKFDLFNEPIKQTFSKNSAARVASQINPVEMVSAAMQTTIMGPGGIQSEQAISDEAKFINPSHLGFIDPINTPESGKTGVSLRLPLGVKKVGTEPRIPLYNLSTNAMEYVSPLKAATSNIVLPDQVKWVKGKPLPLSQQVKVSSSENEIKDLPFKEAQYVMRHPTQIFNVTSNLIPFLGNNSGNRAGMATRHIEQSISLVHREAPLVQVSTGVDTPGVNSFEELLGKQASHRSPASGKVTAIHPDAIHVQGADGQKHEIQIYNNFPTNDPKSLLHSTPLVKVGDTVKAGQVVADTNYSRNGVLALGANLRVGYAPYKGLNFEDGVVISETGAKKLASEHMSKYELPLSEGMVFSVKKFHLEHPGVYTKDQLSNLSDGGVIKVGTKVKPGDPLVVAMRPYNIKDRTGISAVRKSMSGIHTDSSLRWDSDHEGEVVSVHKTGDSINVHVRTVEPMQVGDKLAGRYGNKGIVVKILPDHEMPHTPDKKPLEIILNPAGIGSRMNPGQVLEVAASKIAEKTKKPYIVRSFEPNVNWTEKVSKELKEHGLEDKEHLFDPITNQPMGRALVGKEHIIKLVHQVEKKTAVRSGMTLPGMPNSEHYDSNLQPASGAGSGGQSLGMLGSYALLAHGAKSFLREAQTWRSQGADPQTNEAKKWPSQHTEVWTAIQTGAPLPVPKPTFAFQKFTDMLKGAGINIEKKGHEFILSPLTDKHIEKMSSGALTKPSEVVYAKAENGMPKPKPGGLFDERLTGGHGGRKWSHINLAEPLPNPVFELPICRLTGLTGKDFNAIIEGEKGVTVTGQLTDPKNGMVGGAGIKILLDRIKVPEALKKAKEELNKAPTSKVDPLLKKVKFLQALEQLNMTPSEAYMLHKVPVIPPVMRPLSFLPSGAVKFADINGLYSEFSQVNDELRNPISAQKPEEAKKLLRRDLYNGVKAIMGVGIPYKDAEHKGLLHQISGSSPKTGFFQNVLLNTRQDLSMRSTIVPEPSLGLDEVGLPKNSALTLYSPFIVNHLQRLGAAKNPLEAQKLLATTIKGKENASVDKALEHAMAERPVLLKRDPVLHKYGIQAFKPRAVTGDAIKIHPLVCGGFGADFDGDTMSAYVPITHEAVAEAHKMFPTQNLFSDSSGGIMYTPTLESALGLYILSRVNVQKPGQILRSYSHAGQALDAVRDGKLHVNDVAKIDGHVTTPGRVLLASALPEPMQKKMLTDHSFTLNKKGLPDLLTTLGKDHQSEFDKSINRLKDLGNTAATGVVSVLHSDQLGAHALDPKHKVYIPIGTNSVGLEDLKVDTKNRDRVYAETQAQVDKINASKTLSSDDKERHVVSLWMKAGETIQKLHQEDMKTSPHSTLYTMYLAGTKPNWDQYKQFLIGPGLVKDSSDRIIPVPVKKAYAEGLDVAGYWTQMYGARRGTVTKVQEVSGPGYLTKLLMANTVNSLVTTHDCGTENGVAMSVTDHKGNLNGEIYDRHLAQDLKAGHLHFQKGEVMTPDKLGQIAAVKKDAHVLVRSPLKCEEPAGLCQKCVGLGPDGHHYEKGRNIGVISTQAIGERAVQLSMKAFHTGGAVEIGGGSKLMNSFGALEQLTSLPQTIPDAASLAMTSGKITRMEHDPTGVKIWIGDRVHHVGKDLKGRPLHEELPRAKELVGYTPWKVPQVGEHFEAGQHLSDPNRTTVNPHQLYAATKSIDRVQNHLTNEIFNLYKDEGVKRRNIEVLVKTMSNLTRVHDPGDHHEYLRGEFHPLSIIQQENKKLIAEGKRPIEHTPTLKGVDMLPYALQDDWMGKMQHERLRQTLLEAASMKGKSNIHGAHPIPGLAYGAEFGLTSEKSKIPGYGHLADVNKHHY